MPEPWLIENEPIVPQARRKGVRKPRTPESLYVNQYGFTLPRIVGMTASKSRGSIFRVAVYFSTNCRKQVFQLDLSRAV